MMVAFLIGAAIGFLAGFEEAKTERRYEDADEEPEITYQFSSTGVTVFIIALIVLVSSVTV